MSLRTGTRNPNTPTHNPATFPVDQLAENYNAGRRRDRRRIEKDVARRDRAQQVDFQEKTSCLSFLSDEEQDQCHDQLPHLYTLLFNTPRRRSKQLREELGRDVFANTLSQLSEKGIVDDIRFQTIMNYFMH